MVEENFPRIRAVGAEVVTEAGELAAAEVKQLPAQAASFADLVSRVTSYISESLLAFNRVFCLGPVLNSKRQLGRNQTVAPY